MIIVTGASGLLGSHLIKELAQQGKPIKALYKSNIPFEMNNVEWIRADILDVVALQEIFVNTKQVYHCAASVSFNPQKRKELHETNIIGTTNVVNASIESNIEKLVYVSSVAAFGRIRQGEAVTEAMNWSEATSNSEYGKTKYLAEKEVWRGIGEGLNAVIINPSIILGCGDWNKGSSEIFKSVYNEFPWYTEGVSGFVDVQDVVTAMITLMESNITNERFIVSGHNVSYQQIFNLIANGFNKKQPHKKVTPFLAALVWRIEALKGKLIGKDPLLTKETAATAQAKVYFDNSKLKNFLPAFTYTPIEETINRVCNELKVLHHLLP
jgi:nucleoside-diphosphate-sugar epimerase